MSKKFYITTAIPYVNAAPHLGFALEIVQADVIARYHRLLGDDVFFLTGTDENSLKNVQAAKKEGLTPRKLCDKYAAKFQALKEALLLSFDDFIRTSDRKRHWPGVKKLWCACRQNGDIYQKEYQGLYCLGCEEFKTEKELVNGCCPEHPKIKLEPVKERNYFFRLSRYRKKLEKLIATDKLKIIPEQRKNEVLSFIRQGLKDFSISRSIQRAGKWGIPVPDDPSQVIYVWFDALSNYITALGYGGDEKLFNHYWPADVHVIGKGITRFHAIYWPAILLSAGLPLPRSIFVHGYVTVEGKKIGKSLGNVIDPFSLVKEYGKDAIRYYLLAKIPPYIDGDFSLSRFQEVYNASLANGLGNLVQRLARLCEGIRFSPEDENLDDFYHSNRTSEFRKALSEYRFPDALSFIWKKITEVDKYLDQTKPWEKKGENRKKTIKEPLRKIRQIALLLKPFLPETAQKIARQFQGPIIKVSKPLFPRI